MTYSWQGDIKILPTGSVMAKWVKMGLLIVPREVKKDETEVFTTYVGGLVILEVAVHSNN